MAVGSGVFVTVGGQVGAHVGQGVWQGSGRGQRTTRMTTINRFARTTQATKITFVNRHIKTEGDFFSMRASYRCCLHRWLVSTSTPAPLLGVLREVRTMMSTVDWKKLTPEESGR